MVIYLNIFIIEYVSATYGCIEGYEELLPEGFSMAYSLANTINPYYNSILIVSEKIPISIEGVKYIKIKCNYLNKMLKTINRNDYVIVIAPPKELIDLSKAIGDKIIGPSLKYIVLFSNKYESMVNLDRCGLSTPYTISINDASRLDIPSSMFPIVIKPSMLAGSECVYLVNSLKNLQRIVSRVISCDPNNTAVIQRYIDGVSGSISAVIDRGRVVFYSVNIQLINIENNMFRYIGNILPIRNENVVKHAYSLLTQFASCFPDYIGYIGFDIIITGENITIVEVNPRITTSFIAISQLYPLIGKTIVDVSKGIYSYNKSIYLGDVVDGIGYVFVLSRDIGIGNKIFSYGSKSIVTGITRNIDDLVNIIKSLGYRGIDYDSFKSL